MPIRGHCPFNCVVGYPELWHPQDPPTCRIFPARAMAAMRSMGPARPLMGPPTKPLRWPGITLPIMSILAAARAPFRACRGQVQGKGEARGGVQGLQGAKSHKTGGCGHQQ